MRYTTIIDISTIDTIYNNINSVRIYLHCCLKCGYSEENKDLIMISIRQLSRELNISISAVRNSLKQLQKFGLISISGGIIKVNKWLENPEYAKRKTSRQIKLEEVKQEIESKKQADKLQDEQERRAKIEMLRKGYTPYMKVYMGYLEAAKKGDEQARELVRKKSNIDHFNRDREFVINLHDRYKKGDVDAAKMLDLPPVTL